MTFDFKSGKVFGAGSAEIRPDAEATLDRVAQLITFMGISNYKVEVEGHTDDVPINTARFPSNWELSAARSSAVVRFLISRGVEPKRMGAIGYHADTRPKKPHRDKEGNPIIENRASQRESPRRRPHSALEQIAFTWDQVVIPLMRVNLLYHIDMRANETVELDSIVSASDSTIFSRS